MSPNKKIQIIRRKFNLILKKRVKDEKRTKGWCMLTFVVTSGYEFTNKTWYYKVILFALFLSLSKYSFYYLCDKTNNNNNTNIMYLLLISYWYEWMKYIELSKKEEIQFMWERAGIDEREKFSIVVICDH